jgi:hypothetical protein
MSTARVTHVAAGTMIEGAQPQPQGARAQGFRAPNNINKYDGKTNHIIWLEDDLFIIQFVLIYLADTARAWLDHFPRNTIDSWEDLKEIFIGNFEGTYVRPSNA